MSTPGDGNGDDKKSPFVSVSRLEPDRPPQWWKCDRYRCVFLSLEAQKELQHRTHRAYFDVDEELTGDKEEEKKGYNDDKENFKKLRNQSEDEDEEMEEPPESSREMIARIRLSTWCFVIAFLLALPTVLSFTRYKDVHTHGIPFPGIMLWIDVSWIATLAGYLVMALISSVWTKIFMVLDIISYAWFIENVRWPLTLFLATIITWSTTPLICRFTESGCSANWYHILRKVFHVSIPVAAILLVERMLMAIVVCNAGSQILKKRWTKVRSYVLAIAILATEWRRPTATLVVHALQALFLRRWCCIESVFHELRNRALIRFLPKHLIMHPRSTLASRDIKWYVQGYRDDSYFSDDTHDIFKLFKLEFDNHKMFSPRRKTFNKVYVEDRVIIYDQQAPMLEHRMRKEEIFKLLAEKGQGHIERDWIFAIRCDVLTAYRNINKAWRGAGEASRGVNLVLTLGILIIIALIYAAVFTGKLGSIVAPIWAAFTGLGFALQAPTAEFIACCTFVFSKHPYDVGDTIKITDGKDGEDGTELTVMKMFLTYTVFQQVNNGILVEIQHAQLITQSISNLTRSKHRSVPVPIDIDARSTHYSNHQIEVLEEQLNHFATTREGGCRSTKAVKLIPLWMDNGVKRQIHIKIEFKEDIVPLEERLSRDKQLIIDKFHDLFDPKSSKQDGPNSNKNEMDKSKLNLKSEHAILSSGSHSLSALERRQASSQQVDIQFATG